MIAQNKLNKKKIFILLLAAAFSLPVLSQPTQAITDPEKKYKEAKELFIQEQYALSYPILAELKAANPDNTLADHAYVNEDVNYYYITCALKLKQPVAEQDAKQYINMTANEPRRQLISYHLGKYYFDKEDFSNALTYYDKAGFNNLGDQDLSNAKFEKAYSYFKTDQIAEARPLFGEVSKLPKSKYFTPANYYYGVTSYREHQYNDALNAFKKVEDVEAYKDAVPHYIAEIYYFQGKKEEALKYAENMLAKSNSLYQQSATKLLMGQLYFEMGEYEKARPLLQSYIDSSDKVSNELIYELSYCIYDAGELDKAIEGFKQLSRGTDSLALNSMYLLGDCYLRTNQKPKARDAFQYCAENSSNVKQKEVSQFNYAKLTYELGPQDTALIEMKKYLVDHPGSDYDAEAKEILVILYTNAGNFADALELYKTFEKPTENLLKVYPRILYGRAVELVNDGQLDSANALLSYQLELPETDVTPYANFWKGEIAYRSKAYDSAVRFLEFYLQSNLPDLGEATAKNARYDLGYCWLQKEFYPKALGYFEQVTKSITSTSPFIEIDAYVRSADCYFMNKEFDQADAMYDHLLNIAHIESDYAWFQRAMIAGIKSPAEKIKMLNSLMHLYPKSNMVSDVNMAVANTYMADEKFADAIPYLGKILEAKDADNLKPSALLKLGLSYYNINNNAAALKYYQQLIGDYPQSTEAEEALANVKSIYVEDGKPKEYVDLMKQNGNDVTDSEADSLTYTAAELKYTGNDCKAAIAAFSNYLSLYPEGSRALEANFFRSECYDKNKEWQKALPGYEYVNANGPNRFFEKATGEAARISYFELKDYAGAKKYFESLLSGSSSQDLQLEALRGLVRCYYQLKDYAQANEVAKNLLTKKAISTDDRSIAFLVLGKSYQQNNTCGDAISAFKSCAAINKTAWGAEARYEIAVCQFTMNNLAAAEKAALAVTKETSSYDNWVTKSYILLGDIFMQQKDYFNAKSTYESVAKNSIIPELKAEAQEKLEKAIAEEKATSKTN